MLIEWGLYKLTSLLELKISGSVEVTFPGMEIMLPASLNRLTIKSFQHLKYLSSKGFHGLKALESLTINGCPNLTFIPYLPTSLLQLYIKIVPCQRNNAKEIKDRSGPRQPTSLALRLMTNSYMIHRKKTCTLSQVCQSETVDFNHWLQFHRMIHNPLLVLLIIFCFTLTQTQSP